MSFLRKTRYNVHNGVHASGVGFVPVLHLTESGDPMNGKFRAAIATVPIEQYAFQGQLPLCLAGSVIPALDALKPQADEVWGDGQHEVLTFHYAGHAVNMTFRCLDGTYLFDSVDVWADCSDCGEIGIRTPEGLFLHATGAGVKLEPFDLTDELVYLLPNAVTIHYHKHDEQWMLTKIAGAFLNYENTRASLQTIMNGISS